MLSINDFKREFITCCHDELIREGASGIEIEERSVSKPQLGQLNGIIFKIPGSVCAPTLYIEDFYPSYMEGRSVASLSQDAVETVINSMDMAPEFEGQDFDFNEGSCNLKVRLLNMARNSEYLSKVPYRDLGCGFALIADLVAGEFRANITNDLLEASGMSGEILFERALKNSSDSDPAVLYEMLDAICNGPDDCTDLLSEAAPQKTPGRQFVLSNSNMCWGSAALFYPGVMDKLAGIMGGDFYVLPSSVHELILVAVEGNDPAQLAGIIRSANRIAVDCDDILSDDLYVCRQGRLERVSFGGVVPARESLMC